MDIKGIKENIPMENITPGGSAINKAFTPKPGILMDQVRETLRFHNHAYVTEQS